MPGTSAAAKAKIKFKVPADAVVTITNGDPEPVEVQVNPRGTVQFVNKDDRDYRLRLWTRDSERHADVDLLLPGRGGITVMVDPEIKDRGTCEYEVLETDLATSVVKAVAATAKPVRKSGGGAIKADATKSTSGGGGGGGTIKIGSTPY